MFNDDTTTIREIRDMLRKFRDERDWGQFHDAKNLAEAISIEAAELQELFLWKDAVEVTDKIKSDPEFKKQVEQELADVVTFALNMANALDIDVAKAIEEKFVINNKKYSVEKARGTAEKYDKLGS